MFLIGFSSIPFITVSTMNSNVNLMTTNYNSFMYFTSVSTTTKFNFFDMNLVNFNHP